MKKPKILSKRTKGIDKLATETVKEAAEQAGEVTGGGRDVVKEIKQVREKRKKKESEEKQFIDRIKNQQEKEREQAKKEAQMAGPGQGSLAQTGSKKRRGTVLIKQRGKGREIKGSKQ